jgi:hypothetical protein
MFTNYSSKSRVIYAARKKANLGQLEIDLKSIVYKMWAQETLLKVTLMALLMNSIHKYDNM